jgi:hypothetical protein
MECGIGVYTYKHIIILHQVTKKRLQPHKKDSSQADANPLSESRGMSFAWLRLRNHLKQIII